MECRETDDGVISTRAATCTGGVGGEGGCGGLGGPGLVGLSLLHVARAHSNRLPTITYAQRYQLVEDSLKTNRRLRGEGPHRVGLRTYKSEIAQIGAAPGAGITLSEFRLIIEELSILMDYPCNVNIKYIQHRFSSEFWV